MRDFKITEIEALSGNMARIYSVILDGDTDTLLEQFFNENESYKTDLKKVLQKLYLIANETGCKRNLFKEGEGDWADGMIAIDGTGRLRLYGIYFNDTVILFGSGGFKPSHIRAYEDYPPLNEKAQQMKRIAKEINRMINNNELKVGQDGTLIEL